MQYIVVEKRIDGWNEIMTCSEEIDAKRMVEGLYQESKMRNENREFKYIELPGKVELPKERNPKEIVAEQMQKKIEKMNHIFKI